MWDFDAAYRDNARMVYWSAYAIVKSESDAMDVSQETFLRAHKHGARLGTMNEKQVRAWLYRVAVNLCMDKKRRDKREFPTDEEAVFEGESADTETLPEAAALNKEQKALLRAAIDGLPEAYRQVVTLHYFSGLAYEAIAELTGTTVGTIKSRMSRAKARLLSVLREGGEAHG